VKEETSQALRIDSAQRRKKGGGALRMFKPKLIGSSMNPDRVPACVFKCCEGTMSRWAVPADSSAIDAIVKDTIARRIADQYGLRLGSEGVSAPALPNATLYHTLFGIQSRGAAKRFVGAGTWREARAGHSS